MQNENKSSTSSKGQLMKCSIFVQCWSPKKVVEADGGATVYLSEETTFWGQNQVCGSAYETFKHWLKIALYGKFT